jgi:hypothetical protein
VNLSRQCCCGDGTECDCSALTTVSVNWAGSITFDLDCVPGVCDTAGFYSMPTTVIGPFSVVCSRQRSTGRCAYIGQADVVVTMTECGEGGGSFDVTFRIEAQVYWKPVPGIWAASFGIGIVGLCALSLIGCAYSPTLPWVHVTGSGDEPGPGGAACPSLATYAASVTQCISAAGTLCGVCPQVQAFTNGALSVS